MTSTPHKRAGIPWYAIAIAALTFGLLWLFLRGIDVAAMRQAFGRAHLGLIALALLVTMQTYVIRAWRWQVLLAPLGGARFRPVFRATVIGFAALGLLPGRVGEVLKPYLVARSEGFSFPSTFATVIVERLLDLTAVLLLFACALPLVDVEVGQDVAWAGAAAGAAAIAGLVTLFVCAGHPERLGRWAGRVTRWLPARVAGAADNLVRTFAEGLGVMRRPGVLALAAGWSVPLWLSIALSIWLASSAFDLTFSFVSSFLVVMFLVVGVAAPTPGGVGGFHYMYLLAVTRFFGANHDTAVAAALALHAVSFVPVTVVGLIFMAQDGLTLGRLKALRETAEAKEHA